MGNLELLCAKTDPRKMPRLKLEYLEFLRAKTDPRKMPRLKMGYLELLHAKTDPKQAAKRLLAHTRAQQVAPGPRRWVRADQPATSEPNGPRRWVHARCNTLQLPADRTSSRQYTTLERLAKTCLNHGGLLASMARVKLPMKLECAS